MLLCNTLLFCYSKTKRQNAVISILYKFGENRPSRQLIIAIPMIFYCLKEQKDQVIYSEYIFKVLIGSAGVHGLLKKFN